MIISKLVFDRKGQRADAFFQTDHTTFLKFPDGEILTLTRYEMRGAPLGIAGAPFSKVGWVFVERDRIVTNLGTLTDFEIFDPRIKRVEVSKPSSIYIEMLRSRINERMLEKIVEILSRRKLERLVGFGPGLTPLGDDILSGMIVVGLKVDFSLKTNEISRQQIVHALHGYAPYPVKVFLEDDNDSLIIEMGATSGLGWALGITTFLEWRGENGSLHSREEERLL